MKWQWPWVSRDELEHAEEGFRLAVDAENRAVARAEQERTERLREQEYLRRELDAVYARHERDMVRSEARYSELMASYKALKLQGAAELTKPPTIEPAQIDPVMAAVNAKAPDAATRSAMLRQVKRDLDAGLDPETIIMRINRGNRPAEEVQ